MRWLVSRDASRGPANEPIPGMTVRRPIEIVIPTGDGEQMHQREEDEEEVDPIYP